MNNNKGHSAKSIWFAVSIGSSQYVKQLTRTLSVDVILCNIQEMRWNLFMNEGNKASHFWEPNTPIFPQIFRYSIRKRFTVAFPSNSLTPSHPSSQHKIKVYLHKTSHVEKTKSNTFCEFFSSDIYKSCFPPDSMVQLCVRWSNMVVVNKKKDKTVYSLASSRFTSSHNNERIFLGWLAENCTS